MGRRLILAALALLLAAPCQVGAAAPADLDVAALDAAIAAQMAKHALPGVAVAVVEGDTITYLRGYGTVAGGAPMTPQTPMFIGSQSKSFTALAVAQLAERGLLDLDAPVRRYIPWFAVADPEAASRITVSHLLHHTSGLSEASYGVILPDDATPEAAVRSLAGARLTAPVGTTHQYFNLGYDVLAYLVEVVSGQPYAAYVKGSIFEPLGMERSTADPSSVAVHWGHTRLFGFAAPMPQRVPAYEVGAGYIVSTAGDMARFARAMLHGAGGLVSPAMARRIFTAGPGGYGMGWYIGEGGATITHGGANDTFRTDVNLYPRRERAFVVLVNEGHLVDHFVSASQLARAVEAVVLGGEAPPVSEGWSVRWMGWVLGALVLGLCLLHLKNFAGLRGWAERAIRMSPARRALDVAISFAIPIAIMAIVLAQMRGFFGDRFHLATTLAYFRYVMPDVFILMLVGTLPDIVQGCIKLGLLLRVRAAPRPGIEPV